MVEAKAEISATPIRHGRASKERRKGTTNAPKPSWLFASAPTDTKSTELDEHQQHERTSVLEHLKTEVARSPTTDEPPAGLLELIGSFLTSHGFTSTGRLFTLERSARQAVYHWSVATTQYPSSTGTLDLVEIYKQHFSGQTTEQELEDASSGSTDSFSTSSEEEESDESEEKEEEEIKKSLSKTDSSAQVGGAKPSNSTEASTSTDSNSESESESESESGSESVSGSSGSGRDHKLEGKKATKKISSDAASEASISSASTNAGSNSDEDDDQKGVNQESSKSSSVSSSSESESSESSSDDSEEESASLESKQSGVSVPGKQSFTGKPEIKKTNGRKGSDSSTTLIATSPPKGLKVEPPTPSLGNALGKRKFAPMIESNAETTAKKTKTGSNAPFQRIPSNTVIDPRLSSNAYMPYNYADRAHRDLIVTKGKGFTKEKNKKKRGS